METTTINVADELLSIYHKYGELTPELIVAEATHVTHPLHGYFEWDNAKAAHAHRKQQARRLVRRVNVERVKAGKGEIMLRRFHSVPVSKEVTTQRAYMPVEDIKRDVRKREWLLKQMKTEAKAFRQRWQHMEEFFDVVQDVVLWDGFEEEEDD